MSQKDAFDGILARGVVIGDGAMGTMLYQRGVFINTCFDELNLIKPDLVAGIHASYAEAGADFVETNTFGANEFKLSRYGLREKVREINTSAVQIARGAVPQDTLIAGAMGPLGVEFTEFGGLSQERAGDAFRSQARALLNAGVDFLLLETFCNTDELLVAVAVVEDLTDLPIVAQLSVNENNETIYGRPLDDSIARVAALDAVAAVGLNCSQGPSEMLTGLEIIRKITDKPVSVQPNAGMPRQVENRTLYMCTPEYMAEYAKRFYEKGASIIGGCCGTTPDHIREIARAVRAVDKAASKPPQATASLKPTAERARPGAEPKPLGEKSAFGAKLVAGEPVTAIEITPPRGLGIEPIIQKAKLCAEHGVDAINIPDGPRASSRMSPMVTAIRIQQEAGIESILHFCCRDRNLIGMQSDLLGAAAIGLKNMLIVTGDPPKMGEYPQATGVFDMDSIALTAVLNNLNRGLDIGGNAITPGTALTIGVGANPVAADFDREIERFRQKVIAGAEYAITQPVFEPEMLFRFLDAIEDFRIPVVAGIWPFTSFKNAEFMANEVPGVVVPDAILKRMSTFETKAESRALGIEIAREMTDRISDRVAGFAVSAPFGNVKIAMAVLGKMEPEDTF